MALKWANKYTLHHDISIALSHLNLNPKLHENHIQTSAKTLSFPKQKQSTQSCESKPFKTRQPLNTPSSTPILICGSLNQNALKSKHLTPSSPQITTFSTAERHNFFVSQSRGVEKINFKMQKILETFCKRSRKRHKKAKVMEKLGKSEAGFLFHQRGSF